MAKGKENQQQTTPNITHIPPSPRRTETEGEDACRLQILHVHVQLKLKGLLELCRRQPIHLHQPIIVHRFASCKRALPRASVLGERI